MEIHVGVDVSKQNLDVQLGEQFFQVSNDASGVKKLFEAFKAEIEKGNTIALVVCEASGGYEKLLVKQLRSEGYPSHLAHANKVRAFAKAKGYLAKTDKIDAKVIREYGMLMITEPDKFNVSPETEKLGDLLKRRAQLVEDKKREKTRLDKVDRAENIESIKSHIEWIGNEIKTIEKHLEQSRQSSKEIENSVELLSSVQGVGVLTASYLAAFLPELGHIPAKSIAALVGLAPFNRDSGTWQGKRFIQGGRKIIRDVIYMVSVVCTRFNPDLRKFYLGLRERGKPAKVALIAVSRKLLMMLSSIMKRQTPWEEKMPNAV